MLSKRSSDDQAGTPSALASRSAKPPVLLSVAGFDPSNGAGVSADLQSFAALGCFGTAAITALTVQSTRGVREVQPVEPTFLLRTLQTLREDMPPRGIKLGMLATGPIVEVVAEFLSACGRPRPPVVFDPVLRSSSGHALIDDGALGSVAQLLLPRVDWVTPNWAELAVLSGRPVLDLPSAEAAAAALGERFPHLTVVATGGEGGAGMDLVRLPDGSVFRCRGAFVETTSTHGTGCAFSAALLARLVRGSPPRQAVAQAKRFVEGALRAAPGLGQGRGPMDLLWPLRTGTETLSGQALLGFGEDA